MHGPLMDCEAEHAPWVLVHGHRVVLQLVSDDREAGRVQGLGAPALAAVQAEAGQRHRAVAIALADASVLQSSNMISQDELQESGLPTGSQRRISPTIVIGRIKPALGGVQPVTTLQLSVVRTCITGTHMHNRHAARVQQRL